ncbi:MAG: putative glycosyltransferase [Chloroflexi bacterium]|nr:putative glycosyltransferase [Chloroflexota bacterium]
MCSKALVVGSYQGKLEGIARQGVELVAIVPPSWRDRSYEMRLERLHLQGYKLVVSPIAFNGNFHFFFFPELGRLIDEHRPDVVHVDDEPYNLATFLGAWEARRRRIPSVFFTWQNLARRYPLPFAIMERYVYRAASWGIAGTDSAARVLRRKGYRGGVSVIPQFGVDTDEFAPLEAREPSPSLSHSGGRVTDDPRGSREGRPFTIGFAGRVVPEKGLDLLLEACSGLKVDYRIIILGDGPARPDLEWQIAALGMTDRVRLEGAVASSTMPDRLRGMDVVVLPSRSRPNWTEQFGRLLIEAMACGIPIIGSTCGEIPGIVGDSGLIFPEGETAALRSAIEQLVGNPALRAELGSLGRSRALDRFTNERIAADTVNVYRTIGEANRRDQRG